MTKIHRFRLTSSRIVDSNDVDFPPPAGGEIRSADELGLAVLESGGLLLSHSFPHYRASLSPA